MREDLLGYLLGALEPDEMQRVGQAIRDNPALAAELDRLQAALRPLEEADELYEPPGDLVSRTLGAIDRYDAEHASGFGGTGAPRPVGSPRTAASATLAEVAPTVTPWRCIDCVATAVAAVVLAGLVLPSVLRGRSLARQEGCVQRMRDGGMAVIQFALMSEGRRLPEVAPDGPLAFAGVYAPKLRDAHLLEKPLLCPSIDNSDQWRGQLLPTEKEIEEADPQTLAQFHWSTGGNYAFVLGVHEGGRYVAPRYEGRSHFAILADAPLENLAGWLAHEGRGVNVCYEDGRIRFVVYPSIHTLNDDPFRNRQGAVEAGVDPYDAALGTSWQGPFGSHR